MDGWLTGKEKTTETLSQKRPRIEQSDHLPWVEKYRPQKVDELVSQDEVVAVLKKCIQGADLPNLLFYGPPGTGKTSVILAIARQLFGGEYYRSRVLELNASDERGIAVVREKVKTFAGGTAPALLPDGRPCLPLRLVILDEADSMTPSAQAALRRTMERLSKYTRFCLVCNYVSRIIDPLTSRCAKFRFKPLSAETQVERLRFIAAAEGLRVSPAALRALVDCSEGDLRRSITYLQAGQRLVGKEEELSEEALEPVTGVVPRSVVTNFLNSAASGSYDALERAVSEVIAAGYPALQVVDQVGESVLLSEGVAEKGKARILRTVGEVEARLLSGADEWLQLLHLASVAAKHYAASALP